MKIPLEFTEELEITKIVSLNPPQSHKRKPTEFFIDTGSPHSLIAPRTSLNLDLSLGKFDFKEKALIAGSKVKTALLKNVEVGMRGENNNIFKGEFDFSIAKYHGKQQAPMDNILGMDFLKKFGMNLIVNINEENEAFLEY